MPARTTRTSDSMSACPLAVSHSFSESGGRTMIGQTFSRPLIGGALIMALGLGTACSSHWIDLVEQKGAPTSLQTTVPSDLRVPLLIETNQTTQPHVTIRLTMNNSVEPHAGEAAWSGFIIGASMFLLAPIVTLDYDYGTQMALEVERWDGQTKQYQASSSGTAHYHLFAASQHLIDELKGQVTETCLTQLLDQVIRDTPFYIAGEIAPSEPTIRSVYVGTKRSNTPVHPVSTSLEPAT